MKILSLPQKYHICGMGNYNKKQRALEIIKKDQEIDQLQATIYNNLLKDMIKDKNNIERASSLLLVSTRLERIADQTTNICEEVIFMITGQTVRHKDKLAF